MSNENQFVVKLPTIKDLTADVATAFKNDQLNILLNQEPPGGWIKEHPVTNTKYLPIEKVEYLLIKIFQGFSVEVVNSGQLFNSVYCHVRVKVTNPIDGTFIVHDGVGACAVQTDKGQSAADLSKIKSGAVMMGLPAAKSYAIKDACEHFGKLFGRDLNRKDTVGVNTYNKMADKWTE